MNDRRDIKSFPELMTVAETAWYLGKGRNFVYSSVRDGNIPSVRLGKTVLVLRDHLSALLGSDRK